MKRLSIILGCAAVAAISLFSFWLASIALAPKALTVMWDYNSHLPGYVGFAINFRHWDIFFNVLLILVIAGAGISLFRTRLQSLAMAVLATATLVSILLSLYLLSMSGIAFALVYPDAVSKTRFYEIALDKFAMLQSTKGEFERVATAMREIGRLSPVEVKDPASLPKLDQKIRVRALLSLLRSDSTPSGKKAALATSYVFRDVVISDPTYASEVLKSATALGAGDHHDIEGFYQWLGTTLGQDGWNPVPVYKFVYK